MSSQVDVVVPSVGESVTEGAISRWFVKDGDTIQKDAPLFELDSDKASMEVTAEASGKVQVLVQEGETVEIGAVVAKIDTSVAAEAQASEEQSEEQSEAKAASGGGSRSSKATSSSEPQSQKKDKEKSESSDSDGSETRSSESSDKIDDSKIKQFSPSKRKAIRHGQLSLLKSDSKASAVGDDAADETRTPMTSLRKTIASRLLHSQQSTATLTTFNEVDMSTLLEVRSKLKSKFQEKHGIKLGFMSFFSAAICYAIKEYPIVNSHIDGSDIVSPNHVNLGIAVSTEKGLVVPVVRGAENMSFAEIEKAISELADKARDGKLSIPEMQGGSFTITNGGVFGSLLSTPILNPPQSGILGMHKTEHRPVAIAQEDGSHKVEVRPMMYLALSYDHRIIDGATSVSFLVKIKEYIESVTEDQVMA